MAKDEEDYLERRRWKGISVQEEIPPAYADITYQRYLGEFVHGAPLTQEEVDLFDHLFDNSPDPWGKRKRIPNAYVRGSHSFLIKTAVYLLSSQNRQLVYDQITSHDAKTNFVNGSSDTSERDPIDIVTPLLFLRLLAAQTPNKFWESIILETVYQRLAHSLPIPPTPLKEGEREYGVLKTVLLDEYGFKGIVSPLEERGFVIVTEPKGVSFIPKKGNGLRKKTKEDSFNDPGM